MIFAFGIMLVGPMSLLGDFELVAGQLVGKPATGKTAIGAIVSSLWGLAGSHGHGSTYGFGDTWNQTGNNVERILVSVNNTGLFLDETGTSNARGAEWLEQIMRIATGKTKGRLTKDEEETWYVGLFSTSNFGVAELARRGGREADRAHFDRLIDVPAPASGHGMFDDLRGHKNIGSLVGALKAVMKTNYGAFGRAYITALVRECASNREGRREWIEARVEVYAQRARKNMPGPDRLHRKFGTLYAATALAIELLDLPLKRSVVLKALLQCEADHLRFVIEESQEVRAGPLDCLKDFVHRKRSRMVALKDVTISADKLSGILVKQKGEKRILFASSVFDKASGGAKEALKAKQVLATIGAIKTAGRGERKRFAVKETINGVRVPVINVRASALMSSS